MIMAVDSLVTPQSPDDSTMFGTSCIKLEKHRSSSTAKPTASSSAMLYDCEIEPFEYSPQAAGAFLMPEGTGSGEDSLNSVFGDADLINSIMSSLEGEAQAAAAAAAAAAHAHANANAAPMVVLAPTPMLASYPCLRKPGTFLNKDGRWIKGKPCRIGNCDKRAQSNGLCKGHGGGARCSVEGCSKSSQGGGLCRAHGGGKRCLHEGCEKGTQRNGFCYLHGGVRSCSVEGCDRKDRGNGKCFAHGGGRRCQAPYCLTTIRKGTYCDKHVAKAV